MVDFGQILLVANSQKNARIKYQGNIFDMINSPTFLQAFSFSFSGVFSLDLPIS